MLVEISPIFQPASRSFCLSRVLKRGENIHLFAERFSSARIEKCLEPVRLSAFCVQTNLRGMMMEETMLSTFKA